MAIDLELRLKNDDRVIPVAHSFVSEALCQTPLEEHLHKRLAELVLLSTRDAIDHAYRAGEEGFITIGIRESHGKLEMTVRDYGMPRDIAEMEAALHRPADGGSRLFGMSCKDIADEIHWTGYGPEGKALTISKWLHNTDITEVASKEKLAAAGKAAVPAPPDQYTIRRMRKGEGLQVSQLIYTTYGGSYFNHDVYYPERVENLNAKGTVLSFVAVTREGGVVGHYALERTANSPVAEGGEAVVDPAHRGRKLLERMKEAAMHEAHRIGLAGVYADAVTVHPYTQKSNVHFGARLACADLGIAPKNEHFLGLSGNQPQRISCLLYYLHLGKTEPKKIYVPERHRTMTGDIYRNLGVPVKFGKKQAPAGEENHTVSIDAGAARAMIRVGCVGENTAHAIRHARRELTEHSHAEVVFADLPLSDPSTPHAAEALEEYGFSFAGIAPHFSESGDMLRLVYLTEPLHRKHIVTYEAFAERLVAYALAEQKRVRNL